MIIINRLTLFPLVAALNILIFTYLKLWQLPQPTGRGPRVVVSTAAFHVRVRGSVPGLGSLKETKHVYSPSTCESQYCGEPPWPRGSVLGLRPPGLEFRILCLEDSVISIISTSSRGSPGPVSPICAQRWPKTWLISFFIYRNPQLQAGENNTYLFIKALIKWKKWQGPPMVVISGVGQRVRHLQVFNTAFLLLLIYCRLQMNVPIH